MYFERNHVAQQKQVSTSTATLNAELTKNKELLNNSTKNCNELNAELSNSKKQLGLSDIRNNNLENDLTSRNQQFQHSHLTSSISFPTFVCHQT